MSMKQIKSVESIPYFVHLVEEHLSGNNENVGNLKEILEEVFLVSVERGFTDNEFSVLLKFFTKGSISTTNKVKLLTNLVPSVRVPRPDAIQFLAWFVSNVNKSNKRLCVYILQWLIGLLENDLIDPSILDIFYYDFQRMLRYQELMKYACKLLCKLTKPDDVTASSVYVVSELLYRREDDKYLYALLNLFKSYKPRLVTEEIKRVDVSQVLRSVPQSMDTMIKVANRRQRQMLAHRDLGVFEVADSHQTEPSCQQGLYKASSLIPFPTFNLEGVDKIATCYPNSVKETLRKFKRVPIPQNIMSLMRDDTGFFLILYGKTDLQERFSVSLLQTLQSVFINQDQEATEEDQEFFLKRVNDLQDFMVQGIPCVSTFLSGYLLNWDGLVHRPQIMNLLEWATFDSFQELSANILRPLFWLFVSYNVTMKQQIIQTCTNLIRNMYAAEVNRVRRQVPHPFLGKARAWTADPVAMLTRLVRWMEDLCKIGLCLEPESCSLLIQAVNFYETMTLLESRSLLPMWTVMSPGVIYRSLFMVNPVILSRVCRLLVRYHKDFLPQLHSQQPQFYSECQDKINITSKYAQELINILWNGQAMTRKEDGFALKTWSDDTIQQVNFPVDLDTALDIAHNSNFLPYVAREIMRNGPNFIQNKDGFFIMIEHYLEDITNFIKFFSPTFQTPLK
uniref:Centromere protein I n=1 Tax=Graphocephala atropunctata TaxID=36148 RepID=A0A1B6MEM8_9HEMI